MPRNLLQLFPILFAMLALSSCGGETDTSSVFIDPGAESELSIALPVKIRESLTVDFTQVTGVATVNGIPNVMTQTANGFTVTVPGIVANSTATIELSFTERLPNGVPLILAATEQLALQIGAVDQTVTIREDQYSYNFDDDGDGISNIAERDNDSDPLVPENTINRLINVEFDLPSIIEQPAITQIIVLIADSPRAFARTGNTINVQVLVSTSTPIDIDIRLSQQFNGEAVRLASATDILEAGEDAVQITLVDSDFDFLSFDDDQDGIPNIVELQNGGDPFGG